MQIPVNLAKDILEIIDLSYVVTIMLLLIKLLQLLLKLLIMPHKNIKAALPNIDLKTPAKAGSK